MHVKTSESLAGKTSQDFFIIIQICLHHLRYQSSFDTMYHPRLHKGCKVGSKNQNQGKDMPNERLEKNDTAIPNIFMFSKVHVGQRHVILMSMMCTQEKLCSPFYICIF